MRNIKHRLLSITTSSEWLGIALSETSLAGKPEVAAKFFQKATHRHSDWLIPKIDSLLKRLHWVPEDLGAVAVDSGPGSFTGVRIGLTVARTMSQSLKVPLIGIPSLDIVAAGTRNLSEEDRLACTGRAVPGELYLGLYRLRASEKMNGFRGPYSKQNGKFFQDRAWFPRQDGKTLERLGPLAWMSEDEAERRIGAVRAGGKRVVRIEAAAPDPMVLAGLAHWAWAHGGGQDFARVVPLYLQPSWAERKGL